MAADACGLQADAVHFVVRAALFHAPETPALLLQLLEEGVEFCYGLSSARRGHVCCWPVLGTGDEAPVLVVCFVVCGDLEEVLRSGESILWNSFTRSVSTVDDTRSMTASDLLSMPSRSAL